MMRKSLAWQSRRPYDLDLDRPLLRQDRRKTKPPHQEEDEGQVRGERARNGRRPSHRSARATPGDHPRPSWVW